jgi:hypothetical protein
MIQTPAQQQNLLQTHWLIMTHDLAEPEGQFENNGVS